MSEQSKQRLSRRKFVALTGGILVTSGILAACGDNTATPATSATTAASGTATTAAAGATTAAATTAAPTASAAPEVFGIKLKDLDSGGTLKGQYAGKKLVFVTADGDLTTAIKEVIPYFQKVSGATVEMQTFPGDSFMEKVQLDLQVGHHFDGMAMPIANLHGYAYANQIQDLTPFTTGKIASPNLDMADFVPALLETYGKYQGKLVALPYKPDVQLFFYRKDIFEDPKMQAAFKAKNNTDLKVPTTMEELKTVAAFFTKSLNPDSPTDYGFSSMGSKSNSRWNWTNRLGAYGAKDFDATTFQPAFNNDGGVKALQDVIDLKKYAPKEWLELQWDNGNKLFSDGKVAMMEQWPGLYIISQTDTSPVKGKVGVAVTPGGSPTLGGWGFAITSTTKEPELAYKFIEFLSGKDMQLLMVQHTIDPTRTSNYNRPEVASSNPVYPVLFKSFAAGKILADVDIPGLVTKLNDVEELYVQSALKGDLTPKQALEKMAGDFVNEVKAAGLQK
ncbi:MAG: sugar ABC transporter substrate-binding protein [Chloroflexi bacterium]|nr:sugar ABC transporter substrate-binding protein [Chloroflexota bacterium]OJV99316.1 MAG: hypothetical protein BGO39_13830 [Chloroflexi bacterium 54-19]